MCLSYLNWKLVDRVIHVTVEHDTQKRRCFSIYVDLHNIGPNPIKITNVSLVSPPGFIQLSQFKEPKDRIPRSQRLRQWMSDWAPIINPVVASARVPTIANIVHQWQQPLPEDNNSEQKSKQGTHINENQNKQQQEPLTILVQPNENYRVNFNMQAGRRVGLMPRPDTYTISIEVAYASDATATHHKQLSTEISVFPPIVGMLGGTLLGSFLGTMINNIPPSSLEALYPILLTNLSLGFIAGVVLMRKKDVQPFVTVEDFWGGILLGFLVGFGGQRLFEEITGISLGGNATGTG